MLLILDAWADRFSGLNVWLGLLAMPETWPFDHSWLDDRPTSPGYCSKCASEGSFRLAVPIVSSSLYIGVIIPNMRMPPYGRKSLEKPGQKGSRIHCISLPFWRPTLGPFMAIEI